MQNFSSDFQLAITAAKRAGEVIKAGYRQIQSIEIKRKGRKGIVTDVDKKAEEVILKALQEKSNYAAGLIINKEPCSKLQGIGGYNNLSCASSNFLP